MPTNLFNGVFDTNRLNRNTWYEGTYRAKLTELIID